MIVYNEIDRYPAQWLEALIAGGHIAPGTVDTRSIVDLRADDVRGATQFHTFAGIGGWSYALRLAGWPDDAPVWTGSCPCQPFSTAGRGLGFDDARHLWPVWFELIRECRPPIVFGEQVAGKAGLAWLDVVFADLEREGYACGAADLAAASVAAPHIRQRVYFVAVADANRQRLDGERLHLRGRGPRSGVPQAAGDGETRELADADRTGPQWRGMLSRDERRERKTRGAGEDRRAGELADSSERGRGNVADASSADVGAWSDAEWIPCRDGKSRPAQPGSFPLAHGVPTRVGRDGTVETRARVGELKGYGNAIVPQVAAEWIGAVMDVIGMERAA